MILGIVAGALLAGMGMALIRALRGPGAFERVLAASSFNIKTLLFITVIGFVAGSPADYVDISIMYAVISFISMVAVLRCIEHGGFTGDRDKEP